MLRGGMSLIVPYPYSVESVTRRSCPIASWNVRQPCLPVERTPTGHCHPIDQTFQMSGRPPPVQSCCPSRLLPEPSDPSSVSRQLERIQLSTARGEGDARLHQSDRWCSGAELMQSELPAGPRNRTADALLDRVEPVNEHAVV